MKSSFFLLSMVGLLLFSPSHAAACVCGTISPCEAFGKASAIFIGQMMEGTEPVERQSTNSKEIYEAGTIRFVVQEVFKGSVGREVNIFVGSYGNTSCDYAMIRGEKYLVYAYSGSRGLATGMCTRTTRLSQANEDLQYLRTLPAAGAGGRLYGSIWTEIHEKDTPNLSGVTITITNAENRTFHTVTDGKGNFEFRNLQPGAYMVAPIFPKHYVCDRPKQEITIADRGCTMMDFKIKPDGLVTGRAVDAHDRPVDITVRLESTAPEKKGTALSGYTIKEENGEFEVSGVPPGEYVMYCEIRSGDFKTTQKYYYPGVKNREAAQLIKVGYGQQASSYEFHLPPEFAVQMVEGIVVWEDGSAAAEIAVHLICPRDPKTDSFELGMMALPTKTDKQGRFKLQAFKGLSYWIEARAYKLAPNSLEDASRHSPAQRLLINEDLQNLKIVLSEKGSSGGCGETRKRKPSTSDK